MTKKQTQNPTQKLYRNWTGNQIRGLGQFLVKTWSAFLIKGGQKVSKNRTDLEDFQAKWVHQLFTKTSPNFRVLSLKILRQGFGAVSVVWEKISQEKCRQSDGKMSVDFTLLPHISEYMRKSSIQFDIPSSYLYVVVLKKLPL